MCKYREHFSSTSAKKLKFRLLKETFFKSSLGIIFSIGYDSLSEPYRRYAHEKNATQLGNIIN